MSDTRKELGEMLREARETHPDFKSLRVYAAALGKSPSWVSKAERGLETPGADTLSLMAELLNLPAPHVFGAARMLEPDVQAALERDYERLAPRLRALIGEAL